MKMDCRLYSASSLCDELFPDIEKREEVNIDPLGSLCRGAGSGSVMYTVTELAAKLNMPNWEVVMVFEDGVDQYGILFYEQA